MEIIYLNKQLKHMWLNTVSLETFRVKLQCMAIL
jgi:hypothetical protein